MTFDYSKLKDEKIVEYPIEGGFKGRATLDAGHYLIENGKDPILLTPDHEHFGAARQGFKKSIAAVNGPVDQAAVDIIDRGITTHLHDGSSAQAAAFFNAENATLNNAAALDGLVDGATARNPLSRNGIRKGAAIIAQDGQAVHFMSNNHANIMNDAKAVNKVGMESIAAGYRTATESLEALIKNGGYEKKQIEEIIAKAGPGFDHYLNGSRGEIVQAFLHPGPTPKGGKALASVHLDEVFSTVNTKAANFQREAVALATEVKSLQEVAMPNGKKAAWDAAGKAEKVKLKIGELDKLAKDNAAYAAHIDEALESRFGKEGLAELRKIPNMEGVLTGISKSSGVASGASDAVKSAPQTGKLFSLFHGEEKLAAIAQKEGKAVGDLKFFSKLRPGKTAAVLGVAGVATAYLAGVGRNPDKGKYMGPAMNDNDLQTGAAATR